MRYKIEGNERMDLIDRFKKVEELIDKKIELRKELDTEIAILTDEKDRYDAMLKERE